MQRQVTVKWCPRCEHILPASAFHAQSHRKDGLYYICKGCRKRTEPHRGRRQQPQEVPFRFGADREVEHPATKAARAKRIPDYVAAVVCGEPIPYQQAEEGLMQETPDGH